MGYPRNSESSSAHDYVFVSGAEVSEDDIREVADLHRREIAQGFLSSLGRGILEMLFSVAAAGKQGILIAVKEASTGRACGFALGAYCTSAFYGEFLRKKTLAASIALAPRLFSLRTVRKILETLFYPVRNQPGNLPTAELLDIAVDKAHQGTGLAQELFSQFADNMGEHGVSTFKITTGESLRAAQRFYEKLGAKKAGSIEVHKGQKTYVYLYSTALGRTREGSRE